MFRRKRLSKYVSSLFTLKPPPVNPSTRARYSPPKEIHFGNSELSSSEKSLLPVLPEGGDWVCCAATPSVTAKNVSAKVTARRIIPPELVCCIPSSEPQDVLTEAGCGKACARDVESVCSCQSADIRAGAGSSSTASALASRKRSNNTQKAT